MEMENTFFSKLRVFITTRPNLRHDEMFTHIGYGILDDLFDNQDKNLSGLTEIDLQYPERWLNILEQRSLFDVVKIRCPNIQKIDILTHSVYIIQCTPRECCYIIDDANLYPENQYSLDVRYSPKSSFPNIVDLLREYSDRTNGAAKGSTFTKGVEPNRILQEIVGIEKLRDSETLQLISEIANLLRLHPEQIGLSENQEKIERLREALGNDDPFIIRMDHQLLLIERRNLSSTI